MPHKLVCKLVLILVVLVVGVNSSLSLLENLFKPTPTGLKINGTATVDKILESLKQTIKFLQLDPIKTLPLDLPGLSLRNGRINGLSNIKRVGDVIVHVDPHSTRLSSAFSVINLSTDEDVTVNGKKGHVHSDCEHVTAKTVYKIDGITQTLSLKTFDLTIGDYKFKVTGLGNAASTNSNTLNLVFAVVKGPMLKVFSTALKSAINVALVSAKATITAALTG